MHDIRLSINPTYLCNFRCKFCYLSDEQLSSPRHISAEGLFQKLEEVAVHRTIQHIDLYGGEVAALPPHVLRNLLQQLRFFYRGPINVITNYSQANSALDDEGIYLTVSWDYVGRERHEFVYQRMLDIRRDFSILILASERLVNLPDEELDHMIDLLNALPSLRSVEIKPFSDNRYHSQAVTFLDYERWVMRWIERGARFRFEFVNEANIKRALAAASSSWSDDHLYITPEARFAVLEFDGQGKEYFLEFDDFSFYEAWVQGERQKVSSNAFCSQCDYLGHCLSEHLQEVKSLDSSCNGFRGLLDWYRSKGPQLQTERDE